MNGKITICDAYHENPTWPAGPFLIRCRRHARHNLTLQTGQEIYTVQRCRPCRDELVAEDGATFEILDETTHGRDQATGRPDASDTIACPDCGLVTDADAFCPECAFDYEAQEQTTELVTNS